MVTIRQLLTHTSGFSTLQGNSRETRREGRRRRKRRAGRPHSPGRRGGPVTPAGRPGERWEYSNTNYQILGRLVEVVSGQDYQTYVTSHILEPVGMHHSFVADGQVHDSMATGHTPWFGTKRALPQNATDRGTAPQGGIVASANDLARYLQMMMNGEDDVLTAAGKALMMRPAGDVSPSYGFGWKVDSGSGVVWHDGVSPGFETLAMMVPAEKKAAVVLVNGGSGFGFGETGHLRVGIADRALGLDDVADGSGWSRKALFISLVALPMVYLLSMVWAWLRRTRVRAKAASALRPVQPVVPAAHHTRRGVGHPRSGAAPVRHPAGHAASVPARPRGGPGRQRGDRCAVGSVPAGGGLTQVGRALSTVRRLVPRPPKAADPYPRCRARRLPAAPLP